MSTQFYKNLEKDFLIFLRAILFYFITFGDTSYSSLKIVAAEKIYYRTIIKFTSMDLLIFSKRIALLTA